MLLGLGSVRGEGVGETLRGRSRVNMRGVINGSYSIEVRLALDLGIHVADGKVGEFRLTWRRALSEKLDQRSASGILQDCCGTHFCCFLRSKFD
jgi:hypothetical protein